ncbi:hypothetical protein BP00DRAFT_431710 [Aspergillus indologenus CBS 114.80]|uniref:Uncharacterized protein n=1 Tax=Aspergillus indologenus CBS 114.80 TaxID=1450541 RepID=A0A2V5HSH6_9EURO|nr:hypothetical protein BP00DRAFT_431710 [Aspergillus indologenus CBS 114.80]
MKKHVCTNKKKLALKPHRREERRQIKKHGIFLSMERRELNNSLSFHGLPKLCPQTRSDPGSDYESVFNFHSRPNSPVPDKSAHNSPDREELLKKRTLDFHSDSEQKIETPKPKTRIERIETPKKRVVPTTLKTPTTPKTPHTTLVFISILTMIYPGV